VFVSVLHIDNNTGLVTRDHDTKENKKGCRGGPEGVQRGGEEEVQRGSRGVLEESKI